MDVCRLIWAHMSCILQRIKRQRRNAEEFQGASSPAESESLLGNVEENADQPSQVPAVQLLDDPFEPFLTYEMVSSARRWMK